MKQWYREKFGLNPEAPENKNSFWKLVGIVAKTVTNGVPFVAPTRDMAVSFAKKQFKVAINTALRTKK